MKNIVRILVCVSIIAVFAAFVQAQYKSKRTAEPFSATAMNGQNFDLESLKGKVVVMTFWSTRCPICAGEIPNLNRLADSYKGKDVVFLALSTEDPNRIGGFLKSKPFNFNILPNSFGVVLKYADKDSQGRINMPFPSFYVIDQNGQIELKTSGYDKTNALSSNINRLLTNSVAKAE
ncbi:MAG: TlpA disulfide reductase family protein [Pyrinomonadaceae bacterium]